MASDSTPPGSDSTPPSRLPITGAQVPSTPRTWMPVTAGILTVVAGILDLLTGFVLGTIFYAIGAVLDVPRLSFISIPLIIFGIAAIIGGTLATQRKAWAMALIGAICALMWPFTLLGILAIVFVSIGKKEFN